MTRGDQYIEPNNSYYRPSRDPNEGTMTLVVVITLLFVCLTGVLAAVYFKKVTPKGDSGQHRYHGPVRLYLR